MSFYDLFSPHVQWHSIPYVPNLVNQWICCSFSEMEETDPIKPQKDLFSQLTRSYLFLSPIVPQHTNYHQDLKLMPNWRLNCYQPESATNVKPIQNKKMQNLLNNELGQFDLKTQDENVEFWKMNEMLICAKLSCVKSDKGVRLKTVIFLSFSLLLERISPTREDDFPLVGNVK